jgi:hypothetical protein
MYSKKYNHGYIAGCPESTGASKCYVLRLQMVLKFPRGSRGCEEAPKQK